MPKPNWQNTVCSMKEEMFEVIDENEKTLGLKPRSIVHGTGLLHRGIYLLAFDPKGRLFIQQRAAKKDIEPNKWDLSVAGHPKPGETSEQACLRETKEELGIEIKKLKEIAVIPFYYNYKDKIDNEINRLFAGEAKGKIKFSDGEVQAGKWVEPKKLLSEMEKKPEKFTPWFLNVRKEIENFIQ